MTAFLLAASKIFKRYRSSSSVVSSMVYTADQDFFFCGVLYGLYCRPGSSVMSTDCRPGLLLWLKQMHQVYTRCRLFYGPDLKEPRATAVEGGVVCVRLCVLAYVYVSVCV